MFFKTAFDYLTASHEQREVLISSQVITSTFKRDHYNHRENTKNAGQSHKRVAHASRTSTSQNNPINQEYSLAPMPSNHPTYLLKHGDTPLLQFSANSTLRNADYKLLWINNDNQQLLPRGLKTTPEGIRSWINHRVIPKNRAFANNLLAKCRLNSNRPLDIISCSKGLSLNDCYWVVEENDPSTFANTNLYDNRLSRLLAQVAFTGYGSSIRSSFVSSPEFTTNGMLPKCWRRINGKIYLYKGGTVGFANAGFEPYSEYYAADIAQALGINAINYDIHQWKGTLCSSCALFTSKEFSFVPAANVIKQGGWPAVVSEYRAMDTPFQEALSDMMAFDALICNTDRHLNNFGFLAENKTNTLVAPAPLFDHGNALFYQAYGDDWTNSAALSKYAETQFPSLYDDFFECAKGIMTKSTRAKIRKALDFSFTRKPIKNFPKKRLQLIEEQIKLRAQQLLN